MIIKLPENVISQIAAGEIIDRPSQIVKELVENSIDAKASRIHINFSDGGREILIKDNGMGVTKKDLPLILDRYSTSKISNIDDLWNLDSFGFRGEALHSIASVSIFSITSKIKDEEAFNITSNFGKLSPVVKSHGDSGTLISVKKLFENLPARLKFLKSNRSESISIKKTLKALALINFKTEFKLSQDSELINVFSPKDSFYERAKDVLELDELYHVKKSINSFDIEICFSSPNNTQKTSQNVWIFAQDRWIQDKSIRAATMESYRTLLMHREFPIVVLSIKCKKDEIDINIHPTKFQVKFLRQSEIFNSVVQTLRPALQNSPWLNKVLSEDSIRNHKPQVTTGFEGDTFNVAHFAKKKFNNSTNFKWSRPTEALQGSPSNKESLISKKEPTWQALDIIGQCNCTYIITQSRNSLILIDQHAAHERVLYEKLNFEFSSGNIKVQNNLIPIKIELDSDKISVLKPQTKLLEKIGISISFDKNFIEILSGPVILNKKSIESGLECILNDIELNTGNAPIEENISNIFATMACHSAIRAGEVLSNLEIKGLLEQMDEFSLSSFCPHGRPVYIEYPFTKLDTEFCRIV